MRAKNIFLVVLAICFTTAFSIARADVCPGVTGPSQYGNGNITTYQWDGQAPAGWTLSAAPVARPGLFDFFFVSSAGTGASDKPHKITCLYVGREGNGNIITLSKINAVPAGWSGGMCGSSTGASLASDCQFSLVSPANK